MRLNFVQQSVGCSPPVVSLADRSDQCDARHFAGKHPIYIATVDPPDCYGIARQLMGWQAEQDLDAMCRDSWNWRKKNPDGYNS